MDSHDVSFSAHLESVIVSFLRATCIVTTLEAKSFHASKKSTKY